jgi:hypothetical protein
MFVTIRTSAMELCYGQSLDFILPPARLQQYRDHRRRALTAVNIQYWRRLVPKIDGRHGNAS